MGGRRVAGVRCASASGRTASTCASRDGLRAVERGMRATGAHDREIRAQRPDVVFGDPRRDVLQHLSRELARRRVSPLPTASAGARIAAPRPRIGRTLQDRDRMPGAARAPRHRRLDVRSAPRRPTASANRSSSCGRSAPSSGFIEPEEDEVRGLARAEALALDDVHAARDRIEQRVREVIGQQVHFVDVQDATVRLREQAPLQRPARPSAPSRRRDLRAADPRSRQSAA